MGVAALIARSSALGCSAVRHYSAAVGRYVLEFPLVQGEALDMINLLEEWQWVDVQTRAIILEVRS